MITEKKRVTIYTDGSCKGNPGPGGYAAILTYGTYKDHESVKRGNKHATTNNEMELMAVLAGLEALLEPCQVTIVTDSQYLIMAASHESSWLLKENRPNRDLWKTFLNLKTKGNHDVAFKKIKAHSGDYYNERCDRIAKEQARKACHMLLKAKDAR